MSFDLNATTIEPDDSAVEGLAQVLENQAAQKAVS